MMVKKKTLQNINENFILKVPSFQIQLSNKKIIHGSFTLTIQFGK